MNIGQNLTEHASHLHTYALPRPPCRTRSQLASGSVVNGSAAPHPEPRIGHNRRVTLLGLTLGELLGIVTMLVVVVAVFYRRYHRLAAADFSIDPPPVPSSVREAVKHAEAWAYAQEAWPRRVAEHLQDVVTFLLPRVTYRMDFSVGRYRIKPSTIEALIPWAEREGYLHIRGLPDDRPSHLLPYFAEQPVLNDWQVAVILEYLRRDHPQVREMTWDTIAADPDLVAKLYSGYMGAGGAWDDWRATLTPGPVARQRMRLTPR